MSLIRWVAPNEVPLFTYDAASRLLTGVKGLYSNTVAQTVTVR